MGRPRNRPPEFPNDWMWERQHEDLLRSLAAVQDRKAEVEGWPDDRELKQTKLQEYDNEIKFIHGQLEHYGWGVKAAASRPAKAQSTRSKK